MASESVPTAGQSLQFGHHHPTVIATCKAAGPLWMDVCVGGDLSHRGWAAPLAKGPGLSRQGPYSRELRRGQGAQAAQAVRGVPAEPSSPGGAGRGREVGEEVTLHQHRA